MKDLKRYCSGKSIQNLLIPFYSAVSNGQKYNLNMELFKPIVKNESRWNLKGRNVLINISKQDKDEEEWWPRLT
jgi:hypothetical protein